MRVEKLRFFLLASCAIADNWNSKFDSALQAVPHLPKSDAIKLSTEIFNDMPPEALALLADSVKKSLIKLPLEVQQQLAAKPSQTDISQALSSLSPDQLSSLMSEVSVMRQNLLGLRVTSKADKSSHVLATSSDTPTKLIIDQSIPQIKNSQMPQITSNWQDEVTNAMQFLPNMQGKNILETTSKVLNHMPQNIMGNFASEVQAIMAKLPFQAQQALAGDPSTLDVSKVMMTLSQDERDAFMSGLQQLRLHLSINLPLQPMPPSTPPAPLQPAMTPIVAPGMVELQGAKPQSPWAMEVQEVMQSMPHMTKDQMVQTSKKAFNDMPEDVMSNFAKDVKSIMATLPFAAQQTLGENPNVFDLQKVMATLSEQEQANLMSSLQKIREDISKSGVVPQPQGQTYSTGEEKRLGLQKKLVNMIDSLPSSVLDELAKPPDQVNLAEVQKMLSSDQQAQIRSQLAAMSH